VFPKHLYSSNNQLVRPSKFGFDGMGLYFLVALGNQQNMIGLILQMGIDFGKT
jgi:hypothetical protein